MQGSHGKWEGMRSRHKIGLVDGSRSSELLWKEARGRTKWDMEDQWMGGDLTREFFLVKSITLLLAHVIIWLLFLLPLHMVFSKHMKVTILSQLLSCCNISWLQYFIYANCNQIQALISLIYAPLMQIIPLGGINGKFCWLLKKHMIIKKYSYYIFSSFLSWYCLNLPVYLAWNLRFILSHPLFNMLFSMWSRVVDF